MLTRKLLEHSRSTGFITLQLLLYVLAGMGVVLLLSWGALWVQTDRLKTTQGSLDAIRIAGKVQAQQTKETIQKQQRTTTNVQKSYRSALAELDRLRLSSPGELPTFTDSPERTPDPALQLRPDCTRLRERAAQDALKVHFWQEWAKSHGFPVE